MSSTISSISGSFQKGLCSSLWPHVSPQPHQLLGWLSLWQAGGRGNVHLAVLGAQVFGICSWAGNAFAPDDSKNIYALLLQVASEMDRMTLAWPVGKEVFS